MAGSPTDSPGRRARRRSSAQRAVEQVQRAASSPGSRAMRSRSGTGTVSTHCRYDAAGPFHRERVPPTAESLARIPRVTSLRRPMSLCPKLCPRPPSADPKSPTASQAVKEKPLGKSATYRGASICPPA